MTAMDTAAGRFIRQGYLVERQSDTAIQMIKPKKFSFLWAMTWLLFFGVGIVVYLLYYWAKRDQVVYLSLSNDSGVHVEQQDRGSKLRFLGALLLVLFVCMLLSTIGGV